jgi:hypothetical protein
VTLKRQNNKTYYKIRIIHVEEDKMNHIKKTEELLAKALQSGATAKGHDLKKAREYMKQFAPNKRYQLYCLAGTMAWGSNEQGTVQYAGNAYEYQQYSNRYEVKHNPHYRFLR